jgi:hypothetical protein
MITSLLIVPGLASPIYYPQSEIYRVIELEGRKRNLKTRLVNFKGQYNNTSIANISLDNLDKLKIESSTTQVSEEILSLELETKDYFIIARSFGCLVALNAVKMTNPSYLKRILLWGITPYATMYKYFLKNTFVQDCKAKGTIIGSLADNSLPVEYLLESYNNQAEVRIGCGTLDKICTQGSVDYLLSLNIDRIEKFVVVGANHEGIPEGKSGYDKYIECLFC